MTRWLPFAHAGGCGQTDEWLTPRWIIDALGPFDMDPCSPVSRPWPTANTHLTIDDDGLSHAWHGEIWLNPPYSEVAPWMARLAQHGRGIGLVFARTETVWFHRYVWNAANAALFLRGRLTFIRPDGTDGAGNAGAPSVLIAYGPDATERLRRLNDRGRFVPLNY